MTDATPTTETIYAFRGTELTALISRGTFVVTLDHDASERWGAHAAEGCEAADCGRFRRDAKDEIVRLAREHGCTAADVYATMSDAQDWLLEQLEVRD